MTAQHANGLTEAERDALWDATDRAYVWTRNDQADHDAGHPSGFDCDGYAMAGSESCARCTPTPVPFRVAESNRARAESAEAAHERLRAGVEALHVKTPVFQFAEECPNEEHEHTEDENGDPICRECGVVRHECSFCLDDAWDGIHSDWPCAHALLLGGGGAR